MWWNVYGWCQAQIQYCERVHVQVKTNKWSCVPDGNGCECDRYMMIHWWQQLSCYYLLNWDINDETIRIIKARIRHDSITYRLSHGCTHTLCVSVCGIGIGIVCIGSIPNVFQHSFLGWISAFSKPEQYFLNSWATEKKEICFTKTFFLRYLTNISKLWPFTSWQCTCVCLSVCNCVYFIACMLCVHSLCKISVQVKWSNFVVQTQNCL